MERVLQDLLGLNDLALYGWLLQPPPLHVIHPVRTKRHSSQVQLANVILRHKPRSSEPGGTDEELRSQPAAYQLRERFAHVGAVAVVEGQVDIASTGNRVENLEELRVIDADVLFAIGELPLRYPDAVEVQNENGAEDRAVSEVRRMRDHLSSNPLNKRERARRSFGPITQVHQPGKR